MNENSKLQAPSSNTFPQERSEQGDRNEDCGIFCKISQWWNEFRGGESGLKMGRLDFKWDTILSEEEWNG